MTPLLVQAVVKAINEAKDKAEMDFTNLCILINFCYMRIIAFQNQQNARKWIYF